MHIYGIQENDTDETICRAEIKTQVQRMDLRTEQGKERVGQTESSIEIYALPYVKYIASGKLLHNTGSSAWCSVMTQMCGFPPLWKGSFSSSCLYYHIIISPRERCYCWKCLPCYSTVQSYLGGRICFFQSSPEPVIDTIINPFENTECIDRKCHLPLFQSSVGHTIHLHQVSIRL